MKADFLHFIVKSAVYPMWSCILSGHTSYSKAAFAYGHYEGVLGILFLCFLEVVKMSWQHWLNLFMYKSTVIFCDLL